MAAGVPAARGWLWRGLPGWLPATVRNANQAVLQWRPAVARSVPAIPALTLSRHQ